MSNEDHNSERQAAAQVASIVEMIDAVSAAEMADNDDAIEIARQAIYDSPLSVEFRSGWVGDMRADNIVAEEFRILLCTGGPAVQIIGDIGEHDEPENVRVQHQDWFKPWQDLPLTVAQIEAVTAYCRFFIVS